MDSQNISFIKDSIDKNAGPLKKYSSFNNNNEKNTVSITSEAEDLFVIIENKDPQILSNYFSSNTISNIDSYLVASPITEKLLKNFNPKIINIFLENGFKLNSGKYINRLISRPNTEILLFALENLSSFDVSEKDLFKNIYKKSLHMILSPDQDEGFDFSRYINIIDKNVDQKFINDFWSGWGVQQFVLLKYKPGLLSNVKNFPPKDVEWKDSVNDCLIGNASKKMSASQLSSLLSMMQEMPIIQKSIKNIFSSLEKEQEKFFTLANDKSSTAHFSADLGPDLKHHDLLSLDNEDEINFKGEVVYLEQSVKKLIKFNPSNFIEIFLFNGSDLILPILNEERGRDMIKKSLSKPPIMLGWLKRSSDKNKMDILDKIDLDNWRDNSSNTLAHYIACHKNLNSSPQLKDVLMLISDKYPQWLSIKNKNNIDVIDILKKINFSPNHLVYMEKKSIEFKVNKSSSPKKIKSLKKI